MSVTLTKKTLKPQSGYAPCACRDCMDTTVSSDVTKPELCSECADAGCVIHAGPEPTVFHPGAECQRDDAYGDDDTDDSDRPCGCGAQGVHGVDHTDYED